MTEIVVNGFRAYVEEYGSGSRSSWCTGLAARGRISGRRSSRIWRRSFG